MPYRTGPVTQADPDHWRCIAAKDARSTCAGPAIQFARIRKQCRTDVWRAVGNGSGGKRRRLRATGSSESRARLEESVGDWRLRLVHHIVHFAWHGTAVSGKASEHVQP